jgi:hypothetical protein
MSKLLHYAVFCKYFHDKAVIAIKICNFTNGKDAFNQLDYRVFCNFSLIFRKHILSNKNR